MLVGGLDQVRKRLKQQLGQYEYKQRCESLMIQSSNYYATTENSSFKCQEYDIPLLLYCRIRYPFLEPILADSGLSFSS